MLRLGHVLLGLVLLIAGVSKSVSWFGSHAEQDESLFAELRRTHPARAAGAIAAEISIGAWLLSGYYRRGAYWASASLFALFLGVACHELRRPAPRSCGCFGSLHGVAPRLAPHPRAGVSVAFSIVGISVCAASLARRTA